MSTSLQKRPSGALVSGTPQSKALNAEIVTAIATAFLKRIGHKGGLKPKRVSLEEGVYTVEIEMKKLAAIIRVDSETHEIKEYEIQAKGEEAPLLAVSPKTLTIVFGISALVYVMLYFAFKMIGV